MDIIYSKKRIKFPNIKEKNAKKVFSIFLIILIASITFYNTFRNLNPIFDNLCLEKAKEMGVQIINQSSKNILANVDYNDILKIEKDETSNILKTDVVAINKISSDIILEIENELNKLKNENIQIPIGAITGIKYLIGSGPKVNIKIIENGNISSEIKNEFESQGINQTMYRIYLEITYDVSILTGYKTLQDKTTSQILLVETVIVGDVPQSYYNLEGLKSLINEED